MARRITNHSGRKHTSGKSKGKVFSARHADRNFNTANAPNIDPSLSHLNTYWLNPNLGIQALTIDELERKYYQKYFAEYIKVTNEKHEKSRHYERMIDANKLRNSSRTCIEDTLLYFGDKKNQIPNEIYDKIVADFVSWHQETFPQAVITAYATHRDEPNSAVHTELRVCWSCLHPNGYLYPNQTVALEQMGLQNNGKKNDNAKIEYTRRCREKQAELVVAYGYSVELTPIEGKGGQTLEEFKRDKAKAERLEQEKFILSQKEIAAAEADIRQNRFNKDEVVMPAELAKQLITTSLERDRYKQEYERERRRNDSNIDQERMELRMQLSQEKEQHAKTQAQLDELKQGIRQFLGQKLEIFLRWFKQFREERDRNKKFREEQERIKNRIQNQAYGQEYHHTR